MIAENNPEYQDIFDNLDDSIFAFDKNLRFTVVNARMRSDFFTAFGIEINKGISLLENVPEPIYSRWYERYQRVLNGESFEVIDKFEIENVPEYIKVTFKPLFSNGEIIGGTCHSRDISLQRKAEQKLLENELHLYAQINNTNESIWSVDRQYRILTINKVFKNNFETAFGHVLQKGDCILDYLEGELKEEWKKRYNRALSGEHFTKTDKFEFGDFFQYVEVSFNPILVDEKVVGIAGFTRDITENTLKQQELEIALKKARNADKLKSAFVANISHEIRSPLNSILGFAGLAFDDSYSSEQKIIFNENMINSGAHLIDVIDGIIDISLIESGQLEITKDEFNVRQILEDCISQVSAAQKNTDPKITLLGTNDCNLISDSKRVRQVLINLLTNANKFTMKGKIIASFSIKTDHVQFCIKDTGVGIPTHIGDQLFERFFRVSEVKEFSSGTGLGLAISSALVDALGGKIWYESEVGVGTSFYFTIPINGIRS